MSSIKNKHFTNNKTNTIIYDKKGEICMNNNILSSEALMDIKNQKVVLYLTKQVIQLNYYCNNIIPEEKFKRAIVMFTNRNENFETIKQIIDWHVQNERARYIEHLKRKRNYEKLRRDKNSQSYKKRTIQKNNLNGRGKTK